MSGKYNLIYKIVTKFYFKKYNIIFIFIFLFYNRPTNNVEKIGKSITVVDVQSNKEVIIRERPHDKFTKKFTFDKVFGTNAKQVYISIRQYFRIV